MSSQSYDTGDNAFVLISACLVMFMTPGVGFFYGGMVNKKNLLSTIAYCMLVFSIASIVWGIGWFLFGFWIANICKWIYRRLYFLWFKRIK